MLVCQRVCGKILKIIKIIERSMVDFSECNVWLPQGKRLKCTNTLLMKIIKLYARSCKHCSFFFNEAQAVRKAITDESFCFRVSLEDCMIHLVAWYRSCTSYNPCMYSYFQVKPIFPGSSRLKLWQTLRQVLQISQQNHDETIKALLDFDLPHYPHCRIYNFALNNVLEVFGQSWFHFKCDLQTGLCPSGMPIWESGHKNPTCLAVYRKNPLLYHFLTNIATLLV